MAITSRCILVWEIGLMALGLSLPARTLADTWLAPEKVHVFSRNRKFRFDIIPDWRPRNGQGFKIGRCRGILNRKTEEGEYVEVSQRYLINNIAPVSAYVSPNGRFVITLNEWHNYRLLPIVVYGLNGRLERVFVDSVLEPAFRYQCDISLSGIRWCGNEIALFALDEKVFVIRTGKGPYYLVDLEVMKLVSGRDLRRLRRNLEAARRFFKGIDFARLKREMEQKALESLESKNPFKRATAARWCGDLRLRKALPWLRKMLSDRSYFIKISDGKRRKVWFVARAAREAIEAILEGPTQCR